MTRRAKIKLAVAVCAIAIGLGGWWAYRDFQRRRFVAMFREIMSAPVKPPSWRRHLPASATEIQEWAWADGFLPDFTYLLKARVSDSEFLEFVASLGLAPHTPERKYSESAHWLSWSPPPGFDGKWWDASGALSSTFVDEGHDTWMFAKHENGFLYFKCFSH